MQRIHIYIYTYYICTFVLVADVAVGHPISCQQIYNKVHGLLLIKESPHPRELCEHPLLTQLVKFLSTNLALSTSD